MCRRRLTHRLTTTTRRQSSSSSSATDKSTETTTATTARTDTTTDLFQDFVKYLLEKQSSIIAEIEQLEQMYSRKDNTDDDDDDDNDASASASAAAATFSRDTWGIFENTGAADAAISAATTTTTTTTAGSGGITRVLQGGHFIEKGACSFTLIQQGILSADRAATIRARQEQQQPETTNDPTTKTKKDYRSVAAAAAAGDSYCAAALSMVLHTQSPLIPTFRSDVRIFLVQSSSSSSDTTTTTTDDDNNKNDNRSMAWFGGGADLTPYYLDETDIRSFHQMYKDLCDEHFTTTTTTDSSSQKDLFSYQAMKQACDDYFYLPARSEHRGTGGIFFDDVVVSPQTLEFCKGVADTWMPSWFPIVKKHVHETYTEQQKQWQLLRRGRYLEFNLLYDRGVKFGLANANPRVEGVMVSAPPVIAYEYKHVIEPGSPEDELVQVLKKPRDWLGCQDGSADS